MDLENNIELIQNENNENDLLIFYLNLNEQ
jgi:hypothetical protein